MHGLNIYLLSNERGSDIISQNKEGFFSIFGKSFFEFEYISCAIQISAV